MAHTTLARRLLSFHARYRAADSSDDEDGFPDEFLVVPAYIDATMASTETLITPVGGVRPWLHGAHVHYGIIAAILDARRRREGALRAQAMGQFDWSSARGMGGPRKYVASQFAKMDVNNQTFFWYVNLTASSGRIGGQSSGSHWMVLVIEFPSAMSEARAILADGRRITVECFDPLGNSMPRDLVTFVRRMVMEQLPSLIVVRAKDELYFPDDYDWSVHFDFSALARRSVRMQRDGDGVQCGVWCIWYAHNRCIHGHGRAQEFKFQPADPESSSDAAPPEM